MIPLKKRTEAVAVSVPPKGAKTIQEALPEGFEEIRVKGSGIVWEEWVQQPLILAHPCISRMLCEQLRIWVNVGVSDE
ncbi:hypothetical protein Bca52824_043748 [Brassica carinata]|uniref:Uncharacterized protein n=1 Tax=Brassica carinata TaxID=52824 RepID=A0A8X7RXY5_BRACI|nr:hypothetical protein Bca52824_043748 [Brassica carinata]